ncbi:hypothetical protein ACS15_5219 [Ralstonia insidiosa]|uniref:Uncharacterized protein n=1 Tax=Ralstonia insidiosa TaxID=190721 RepID=A0AAC9BNU7_9RALS|nr:hypothetical protein ACS15_5219 [Ralstonia insidiosa]
MHPLLAFFVRVRCALNVSILSYYANERAHRKYAVQRYAQLAQM